MIFGANSKSGHDPGGVPGILDSFKWWTVNHLSDTSDRDSLLQASHGAASRPSAGEGGATGGEDDLGGWIGK